LRKEVESILKRGGTDRKILLFAVAVVIVLVAALNLLLWNQEHTYTILDGSRVVIHTSREEAPERILAEVGIELDDWDRLDILQAEGQTVLQVLRQQKITVDDHGELVETVSYGETVGQLLKRLDIALSERETLSLPMEQETFDGMVLRVYREIRQEQIYTVTLPRQTYYCCDPTLPIGTQQILTEGKDGELLCRAEVTYIDGREVSRKLLSEEVITRPVTAVVAMGTGQQVAKFDCTNLPQIGNGVIYLSTGEVLTYSNVISSLATAYCDKGKTATGTQARVCAIAVDPEVIPYGTRMFIMTKDGEYIYGIATAEDCGSKDHIYGTRIDLHYDTEAECVAFGARMCWVYFLC
jgi:uncharacterized protein YabE (DUF348 family)/3D (Asp-Asp-Asp) domain-containing protein